MRKPKRVTFFDSPAIGSIYGVLASNGVAVVLTHHNQHGFRAFGVGSNFAGQLGSNAKGDVVEPVEIIELRGREILNMWPGDSSVLVACGDCYLCLGPKHDEGRFIGAPNPSALPSDSFRVLYEIEQEEPDEDDYFSIDANGIHMPRNGQIPDFFKPWFAK